MNKELIRTLYSDAISRCNTTEAWLFEEQFTVSILNEVIAVISASDGISNEYLIDQLRNHFMEDSMERTRGDRIANTDKFIKRQVGIQKRTRLDIKEPHRYAKQHAMDCGQPDCYMCGNRRQHDGKTIQEQSFEQTESWIEP